MRFLKEAFWARSQLFWAVMMSELFLACGMFLHMNLEARSFYRMCEHEGVDKIGGSSLSEYLTFCLPIAYQMLLFLICRSPLSRAAITYVVFMALAGTLLMNALVIVRGYDGECFTMGGSNNVGEEDAALMVGIMLANIPLSVLALGCLAWYWSGKFYKIFQKRV